MIPTPPVCESCGGSGTKFDTLGPFYAAVPKCWRETVEAHVDARREVFKVVDREIARQVVSLERSLRKKDLGLDDILIESLLAHERANEAWIDGRPGDASVAFAKVLSALVYVLESYEVQRRAESAGEPT